MKVAEKNGLKYLEWGWHELAFSLRTSRTTSVFLSEDGRNVGKIYNVKTAGRVLIPPDAKYFYKRYYTNKGYPNHVLYELPSLKHVTTISMTTIPDDIEALQIPEGVKKFIIEDVFEKKEG